jgi:hypothetical protein
LFCICRHCRLSLLEATEDKRRPVEQAGAGITWRATPPILKNALASSHGKVAVFVTGGEDIQIVRDRAKLKGAQARRTQLKLNPGHWAMH